MGLAVTAMGALSSVGRDVVSTCASLRAGISRPFDVPYFQLLDEEQRDTAPLVAHPIRGFTEGFNLVGRWLRIANACLDNLLTFGRLSPAEDVAFWRRTAIVAVTPPAVGQRFQTTDEAGQARIRSMFLVPLIDRFRLPFGHDAVLCAGQAGTAAAIEEASKWFESGKFDRAVVLGVDSYLDPLTLEWLSAHRRLRSEKDATGLTPGEAGACFLLETPAAAKRRHVSPWAEVTGVARDVEGTPLLEDRTSNGGAALARAWLAALAGVRRDEPLVCDVVTDLNGEPWRAYELGSARSRIQGFVDLQERYIHPATSIGDVGAAGATLGVCMATRAFQRQYAAGSHTFVLGSSEEGSVGVIRITKPNLN